MARRLPLLLIPTVLLTACGGEVSQEDFPAEFAPLWCDQQRTCARGFFESEFRDEQDCISSVQEDKEALGEQNDAAGCVFDAEEAQACLIAIREASCEDWYEGEAEEDCAEVWTCAGTDAG